MSIGRPTFRSARPCEWGTKKAPDAEPASRSARRTNLTPFFTGRSAGRRDTPPWQEASQSARMISSDTENLIPKTNGGLIWRRWTEYSKSRRIRLTSKFITNKAYLRNLLTCQSQDLIVQTPLSVLVTSSCNVVLAFLPFNATFQSQISKSGKSS